MPETGSQSPGVLVIAQAAGTFMPQLRQRFPGLRFHVATTAREVNAALSAPHRPQVVLSCKSPALPGPVHRPAVACPSVEWVHVAGAGFEHLLPLSRPEVVVTNSAGVLSEFMAQTVLGALLMLNFGLPDYLAQQRAHRWQARPWSALQGKTVLIVGLGNIGRAVAVHCRTLGLHVLGMRRRQGAVDGVAETVPPGALHAALARSDALCLHVPLTAHTRGLVDRQAFAAMKPGAILVNTSRGGVVDEVAMLDALASGRLRGAFVDVFQQEPLPADSPLWEAPNLIVTPHVADSVSDYEARFAAFFADNLERWLRGQSLLNVVDPEAGY